jgi:hypothetical protein
MLVYPRSRNRPFHHGPFPLETLPRDDAIIAAESDRPPSRPVHIPREEGLLVAASDHYSEIYSQFSEGDAAPAKAPVPDDLERRAVDLKGAAYFMDASQVGICRIPDNAWLEGAERAEHDHAPHDHAVVILVEHGRVPEPDNLAHAWVAPSVHPASNMRAAEIAGLVAGHIRTMGWTANTHFDGNQALDIERLAVLAGLVVRQGESIVNPYLDKRFSLAVVSTEYAAAIDPPLAVSALKAKGFRYWLGQNGAPSGRERNRRAKRRSDLGPYPMETVKTVDEPTTLILEDEVPRVPKRAAFFERALQGDLGAKAQAARRRFSFKHPMSYSQLGVIRAMVPHQDGAVAETKNERFSDPKANSRAIKALSYFLGADITGICEAKEYTWYSHKEDGKPIEPYHKYAVVMLIDQGFETMEGGSGDDWIICGAPRSPA